MTTHAMDSANGASSSSPTSPPNTHNQNPRRAWAIMDPVRWQIRFALVLSCLSCVCTLAALLALAWALHSLQNVIGPAPEWGPNLTPVIVFHALVAATLATMVAYVLRRLSFDQSHVAAFKLETILRTQLTTHIAALPLGRAQQIGAGALAKVVYDDVKELHVYVADSTPLYARAYFLPVITLLALLCLDWRLALAAVGVLVMGMGILNGIMKDRPEIMRRYNEEREKVSAAIIEYVQAMPVVRSFDSGQSTFGRYQNALNDYLRIFSALWLRMALPAKLSMALLNPMPTLAVLLWLGAYFIWRDSLAFSTWIAVLLLGTGMAEALTPLHSIGHLIDRAKISVGRIQEIMDIPVLVQPEHSKTPHDTSVVFENVSFAYETGHNHALKNISFIAKPGTVTALVGPSGAGKTTVARLIPRFWDVTEGRILVGGCDVRELSNDCLMQQVAFVFQDTFLFSGSIADNIRLGLPDATLEQIQEAARKAQAHEFIEQLPQGYDTDAGERGSFLSGGQRQRITLARAILQNRPILVLDEATAFADPENEAAIISALSELMRGKTVLMVAHRLSTICDADQILVFDRGQLVERGKHHDLLTQQGTYARLWNSYQQAQNWALGDSIHALTKTDSIS